MLEVRVAGPLPDGAAEAWAARLRAAIAAEDLVHRPAGTPGAVPVSVEVTVEAGGGATETGTPFVAARASAVLRVGRQVLEVEGRHFAGVDREDVVRRALEDILPRVAVSLAP